MTSTAAPVPVAPVTTAEPSIPWPIAAVLFASTSVMVGVLWDISWHRSIGRDSFWTAAHLAIYAGGVVAGLACGWLALATTFGRGRDPGPRVPPGRTLPDLGAGQTEWTDPDRRVRRRGAIGLPTGARPARA